MKADNLHRFFFTRAYFTSLECSVKVKLEEINATLAELDTTLQALVTAPPSNTTASASGAALMSESPVDSNMLMHGISKEVI